jgi:hypothetical protein
MSPLPKKQQHIQQRFSPLVIAFISSVFILTLIVVYLAFGRTTITIAPAAVPTPKEFTYLADDLDARIVSTTIENDEYTYTEFKSIQTQAAIARGVVTIYNNYTVEQPLLRTTRLLSQSGVLFHTDQTVTVPAGGSVTVPVYADQPGENGDITPERFEIVALWAGLKNQIYAESTTSMTGGIVTQSIVTESDIEKAKAAAEQQLRTLAVPMLRKAAQADADGITPASVAMTMIDQTITPTAGSTTDQLVVTTTVKVTGLAFNFEKLANAIEQDLNHTPSPKDVQYTVSMIANNQAQVTGKVVVPVKTTGTDFIDKTKLTNKSAQQIVEYVKTFPEVESASVQFSPFWLQSVPAQFSDRITIRLK